MKVIAGIMAAMCAVTFAAVISFAGGLAVGYCAAGGGGAGSSTSSSSPAPGGGSDPNPTTNPDGSTNNPALWVAITSTSNGNNRLTLARLMATWLESRWNNNGNHTDGAWGPWRIQQPSDSGLVVVHPDITMAQAVDPVFSTNYMLPAYIDALSRVPESLWASNPAAAAEQTAFLAEKPALSYSASQGPAAVQQAYEASLAVMQAYGSSTTSFAQPSGQTGTTSSGDCGSNGGTTGNNSDTGATLVSGVAAADERNTVLAAARSLLGVPYSFAGGDLNGPTLGVCTNDAGFNDCHIVGIDCSGLVLYAFGRVGIPFPHLAATQYSETAGYTVVAAGQSPDNALPGDLVFFDGASAPGHVAIYIGNGQIIQAPQSGDVVKITKLSDMSPFTAITDPFAWWSAQKKAA